VLAEVQLDAVGDQRPPDRLAHRPRLAREHVLVALDERDLAAEAPDGLGHLDADGAAAETSSRRGTSVIAVASRLVHTPSSLSRPGSAAVPGPTRSPHDVVGGQLGPPTATRPGPVTAAHRGAGRCPSLEPRDGAARGVAGDHEVAPPEAAADVELPPAASRAPGAWRGRPRAPRRAQQRLDGMHAQYEHSLDELALDDGHALPPSASARRRTSPAGPREDDTSRNERSCARVSHPPRRRYRDAGRNARGR
jgi:hypothetical protein